MAVEHLISHGHECIGLVMGNTAGGDLDAREVGWRQGIQDAGLTPGPIVRVPFTREGGYRAGQELLARSEVVGEEVARLEAAETELRAEADRCQAAHAQALQDLQAVQPVAGLGAPRKAAEHHPQPLVGGCAYQDGC